MMMTDMAEEIADHVEWLIEHADHIAAVSARGEDITLVKRLRRCGELLAALAQQPQDHVEVMKRIAGDSAQEPDAWIQADHLAQAKRGAFMCRVEAEYRKGMDLVPIFAAPSASARQAEPEKVSRRVHLSAAQLLEALEFVAPDRDTDQDQLDGEVTIEHGEGHSGTGYYCYVSDYPEEGAILLDGESASSIIAAPAPASPDEYIKQLEKETSFAKTTLEATREAASGRNKGASPADQVSAGSAESWKQNAIDNAVQKQSLQDAILKAGRDYVRSFLMADEIPAFDVAMATADMRHADSSASPASDMGQDSIEPDCPHDTCNPAACRCASPGALMDAVDRTIQTIERQLELIAERAPGAYLDKRPVVQSLTAHVRRLRAALLAASPAKENNNG